MSATPDKTQRTHRPENFPKYLRLREILTNYYPVSRAYWYKYAHLHPKPLDIPGARMQVYRGSDIAELLNKVEQDNAANDNNAGAKPGKK